MKMIGTAKDEQALEHIRRQFPGSVIDAADKEDCRMKKKNKNSMEEFFRRVDKADVVVSVEAAPGHFSAGVYAESQHAIHDNKPVHVLNTQNGSIKPIKALRMTKNPDYQKKWGKVSL